MKIINIKNIQIEEIIIRPNENIPISVSYRLLDENNNLVMIKKNSVNKDKLTKEFSEITGKILKEISMTEEL